MEKSNYQIGVDVGGTFTDIFIVDTVSGTIAIEKVSSTTSNQALGFMEGITNNVSDLTSVGTIVHGTTVGTNALLERKGAKTGLITTEGFGDVL